MYLEAGYKGVHFTYVNIFEEGCYGYFLRGGQLLCLPTMPIN
jgi:hypothetical protein